MSRPSPPPPVKLIVGLLAAGMPVQTKALRLLEEAFGPIEALSETVDFKASDYYTPEMGSDLIRRWVSLVEPVEVGRLARIKLATIQMEDSLALPDGRRRVNLDPGLLSLENLVLATGKAAAHRVYLGEGIYAEVSLIFQSGRFERLAWTYPDYSGGILPEWLSSIRQSYKEKLREDR